MTAPVEFSFPTRIIFGPGASARLSDVLRSRSKSRPLIITDQGVAKLPFLLRIVSEVSKAGLTLDVFSGVSGNPVASQVMKGVVAYRAHNADALVLIGGGAAIDVGKAVALMVEHLGQLFDYEDGKPDARPVDKDIPFMVAIPTTSGTGSEVGRSSVISDDVTRIKRIIFSPRLLPPAVLADPELTLDLPGPLTAATGMDALSHCIEAFLSKGFHPMCDGIALEGARLVSKNLITCYRQPRNIEARGNMMMASTMGAVAFQKGLGVVHSCAHALSAVCDMHHGLANALMMIPCMQFNADAVSERMTRLALTVDAEASPKGFISWLKALLRGLDMPKGLRQASVSESHLDALVETAFQDVCHSCNPRPVTRADFANLFQMAL